MIYSVRTKIGHVQSVFTTRDFALERGIEINRKWSSLASGGYRQVIFGEASNVEEGTLDEKLRRHIADFPHEMILTVPPRPPGDFVQFINHGAMLAVSKEVLSKVPDIECHLTKEGSVAEYPFAFDLSQLDEWLSSESNVKKWPALLNVGDSQVEVKWSGETYFICNTKKLIDYRIHVFICSNWLPGILDRKASKGSVNQYLTEKSGNEIFRLDSSSRAVFRSLPPSGTWFFRVPESPVMLFCSQDFKDLYERHGLQGLLFEQMEVV